MLEELFEPNLFHAVFDDVGFRSEIGAVRESFFVNQVKAALQAHPARHLLVRSAPKPRLPARSSKAEQSCKGDRWGDRQECQSKGNS